MNDELSGKMISSIFFDMQNLMFQPRDIKERKSADFIKLVEKEVIHLKEYCSDFIQQSPNGSMRISPRTYRIANEFIIANLDPVLARACFVCSNCSQESVGRFYYYILHYYNSAEKPIIGPEMMQLVAGKMLSPCATWMGYEQEPIFYFNDDRKVIGPKETNYLDIANNEYEKVKDTYCVNINNSQNIYLRIGRFSTKEDVKWFLDKYWDEMTADMPYTKPAKWRMTNKRIRTLLTDCMLMCDLSYTSIKGILDKHFSDKDSSVLDSDVQKDTVNKAKKKLIERLKADAFDFAYREMLDNANDKISLSANPQKSSHSFTLDMKYDQDKETTKEIRDSINFKISTI